jgi:NTE family protein
MKTAFILAGGGSLGAIQVGMLQALVEYGVEADVVIGSSVGAINAARFAQEPDRRGADTLAAIWSNIRRNDVFRVAPIASLMRLVGYGHDGLIDPSGLRRLLERHLSLGNLEDAKIQCAVVASDLFSGEMVLLDRGPAIDAILASAAIPGVFPPVEIDGRRLIDGGVAANTPVAVAQSFGAERIVVLPTGKACAPKQVPTGPLGVTLQAINHLINAQLIQDVERLRHDVCISLVPPVCHISVNVHDFSRTREMIDDAYASTLSWLEAGGVDRCEIPEGLVVPAGVSGWQHKVTVPFAHEI